MQRLKERLKSFKSNARAKQSFSLLLVNFAGIPLGLITSIMLTSALGAEGFGDYSFIISIFTFAVLIATFGFFHSGSRVLVLNHNHNRAKQYYGAELIILLLLFLIMTGFLFAYGSLDQNLKEKELSNVFLMLLPLGFIFLAGKYIETLLQADNRIGLLSTHRLLTKLVYLISLITLFSGTQDYNNKTVLFVFYLFFISQFIVFLIVLWFLKPTFKALPKRLKDLWLYNKSFGFNVYIGSVFAVSFTSISQILISYFSEINSSVGFYTLALTFAAPLGLIPNTIATAHYRDFARTLKIPSKLLKSTLALSFLALMGLWIILPLFIGRFYGKEFTPVVNLTYLISVGVLVHGFGDFYNRFLGANGQAIALRNSAFIVGGVAMLASIMLIPVFGEYGAATAKVIVGFVYLSSIYCYYFKYTNRKLNLKSIRSSLD